MIEAGAHEASESDMLDALMFGQKHIKELCEFQESIIEVVGKEKKKVELASIPEELEKKLKNMQKKICLQLFKLKINLLLMQNR